jgi:hypothetical protein
VHFAVLSAVAVTIVLAVELLGALPPPLSENSSFSYWINHLNIYGIAAALLYLAVNSLTSALQKARELAAESRRQNEEVQILMQERTQNLMRSVNYLNAPRRWPANPRRLWATRKNCWRGRLS